MLLVVPPQVWLQQSRIGLSLYDISGLGYLREADLENYILVGLLCKVIIMCA